MPNGTSGIMAQLKEHTQPLHHAAEQHEFQSALNRGQIPREAYVNFLSQMFLVHRELEGHLRRHVAATAALCKIVREHQYQEPYLRSDLTYFGVDVNRIEATPATQAFLSMIEQTAQNSPLALLGFHYVLEGSNNGSKFVARNIQQAYGLAEGEGLRYLDPYGNEQRQHWQVFKEDMDAARFTGPEIDVVVDAAKTMFRTIARISDDLLELSAA